MSFVAYHSPPPDGLTMAIYDSFAFKHLVDVSIDSLLAQKTLLRGISKAHRKSKPTHYYPRSMKVFVGNYISWRDRIKSVIDALWNTRDLYNGRADSEDFD